MTHIDKMLDLSSLNALLEHVAEERKDCFLDAALTGRELTFTCRKKDIVTFLKFLRDDKKCQFKMLLDVCGVDWPERDERFDVVYHLLSLKHNLRVRVKAHVEEGDSVPSVTGIFGSANWYERETYDMFGIPFENHPDLRRILTDYDFDGWPLRKDFPVEGKVEVYYDKDEKRVAYKPVDLPQEYRHFDWVSPWEAMEDPYALSEEDNEFDRGEFEEEPQEKSA